VASWKAILSKEILMSKNKWLKKLEKIDEWKKIGGLNCDGYIHRDHRYCLIPAFYQSFTNKSFKPMTLIGFDWHHDTITPQKQNIKEIKKMMKNPSTFNIVDFVKNKLKKNNDDWIITGMELGLIDNAIIFGVNRGDHGVPKEHIDHKGETHKMFVEEDTPGEMFSFKGKLSDITYRKRNESLWKSLGWSNENEKKQFDLMDYTKTYWLNIDLDCFVMDWDNYLFPWEDIVFRDRFIKDNSYGAASGWTGQRFVQSILERSNLLTIATEPKCCGGFEKAEVIQKRILRYMFNSKLIV